MQHCPCRFPCEQVANNATIMHHGEAFRFTRGQILWEAGDTSDWIGCVCSGFVKRVTPGPLESAIVLDVAGRGGMIGAEAALRDHLRPSTCVALTAGRGIMVSKDTLRSLMNSEERQSVAELLLSTFADQVESQSQRVGELTVGTIECRLAAVMSRLAQRMGLKDARGVFLPIRLTRSELARFVSCREETVIRLIKRWERLGWIDTQPEGFIFHDLPALTQLGVSKSANEAS